MTCCKKSKACVNVNGTMNRHRVPSLIGALALPETEQRLAFEHFGHSEEINRHVYQVPQAEQQLKSTGRYLQLIDNSSGMTNSTPAKKIKTAKKSKGIHVNL